jgi:TetR/AcrR family transcriptional regulator, regulator of biofilm formation and stress response
MPATARKRSSTQPLEPVQERSEATRDRLLRATIELLASGGPRAVTHRAVAEAAGAAHGSTRYYFANRDELIRAALRKLADEDVAAVAEELERAPHGSAEPQRIARRLSALLADRIKRDPDRELSRYELFLLAAREPALRPDLDAWGNAYRQLFVTFLQRLASTDPETDAHLILSVGNALLLEQVAVQRPNFEAAVLRPALTRLLTVVSK